ncbi:MAG: hypothetical protein HY594_04850 [Candidatus Omnitrophica bacterium]|nr:hypothetical protein [Candidatus Omnitrophota bacterium]
MGKSKDDMARRFLEIQNEVLTQAKGCIQQFPAWSGGERVLNKIRSAKSESQMFDDFVVLRVATILTPAFASLALEEPCRECRECRGPHDIVTQRDGHRVVNEVRRIHQTPWSRQQMTSVPIESKGDFHEIQDDPQRSTTGSLNTLLNTIESKEHQLHSGPDNVVWIVEEPPIFYGRCDMELVARIYQHPNSPGQMHFKPEHLTALGWIGQADPPNPICYSMRPGLINDWLRCADIEVAGLS